MKKHFVRLFAYLVIIALVLQTTPIQALPITDASSAPRQDLTAWQLEPKLPNEALSPGEDLRTPAEQREYIPPTAAGLSLTAMQVRTFDCTTVTEVPTAECEALVALYDSTNGVAWTNSTNWLITTTMGEWYGVTVLDGHISRLSLYSNQLSGSIPVEFGNLGSLQYVEMYDNLLTGSIPSELGNLGSLKKITLNSNQLTGLIPERLVDLENLYDATGLNLSHNYLITNRYSQTLLDFLALKDPDWESTQENICNIVTEIPTSECDALVTLYNSTNGPGWTTQTNWLANIQPSTWYGVTVTGGGHILSLTLGSNQLSGNIPVGLGFSLNRLQSLYLDSNQLSGSIPSDLSNLFWLQELRLSSNQLSGSIPAALGNLDSLYYLRLDQNKLSGNVPAAFVNLVNLCTLDNIDYPCYGNKELDLGYNHLNVPAPEPPASFLAIKDPDWHLTQAVEEVIIGATGGTVLSNDLSTEVEVPAGAVSGNITFLFEPQPSPSQDTGLLAFAGNSFMLTAWDSLDNPVTVFNAPITSTIAYDEGDLGDIAEETLGLFYWDASGSAWLDVVTACPGGEYNRNLENNWLSVPVCHLSEFALLGENVYTIYMPLIFR